MATTPKIMSALKRYLKERGFEPMPAGEWRLRGMVYSDTTQWHWTACLCGADGGILAFRAFCPMKVPARRRQAVAEYIVRANWGLNFGNFEMDCSDGEVSFRTSIPACNSSVSAKALGDLVYCPCALMDRYLPGLLSVALGNADPKSSVAEAEREHPAAVPEQTTAQIDSNVQDLSGDTDSVTVGKIRSATAVRLDGLFEAGE